MIVYNGIDVSEFQNPKMINYDELCKHIDFAIIRAGFTGTATGATYVEDKHFRTHYAEFKQRGIPVGAYWYSCADTIAKGKAEAEFFYSVIKGKTFEMPVYIDTEDNVHQAKQSPSILTDAVVAFCDLMENSGYYVGIYASEYWFNTRLVLAKLKDFDLWVANWDKTNRPMPSLAGLWQYSSRGQIRGYIGNLDMNSSYKDYPNIIRQNKLNGFRDQKTKILATKVYDKAEEADKKIKELVAQGFNVMSELI